MTMKGVFWFDPGVSTGMAWGVYNFKSRTVADAMRDRQHSGSATFKTDGHEPQDAVAQAAAIFSLWRKFANWCVHNGCLDPDMLVLGAEHFILTPGPHTAGTQGIFPAFVLGAFEGYRRGLYIGYRPKYARSETPLTLQPAGKGKKYDNQKHLKPWGAWVVGKEHERTAFAHTGAYLMDHLI